MSWFQGGELLDALALNEEPLKHHAPAHKAPRRKKDTHMRSERPEVQLNGAPVSLVMWGRDTNGVEAATARSPSPGKRQTEGVGERAPEVQPTANVVL